MEGKKLLLKLGEETLYSAKGHFKACDIRRQSITYTIWLCAILNVIGLFGINAATDKILTAIGLVGTMGLLIWNEGEGKNYRIMHKDIAEKYLALHKEIRSNYLLGKTDSETVSRLNNLVIELDQSKKPEIPGFAKRLAKAAIEKNGETDNWFSNPI